jgi:hypothetical protein
VQSNPYGFPIAMAICPTRTRLESASAAKGQSIAGDADDRQVGVRIVAEHFRARLSSVGERHARVRGTVDHMTVRHEQTVRREEESRSGTLLSDFELDDRRRDGFDGADNRGGVGVEKRRVV